MLIFRAIILTFLANQCLCGLDRTDCRHNQRDVCSIEALFGNLLTNTSIDVVLLCTNQSQLSYSNQFSAIDKIEWNGCNTPRNIKCLGLRKIPWRNSVKHLKVEKFAVTSIEAGTFDGFSELEVLSIQSNSIENILSSSFRGLQSLSLLEMIENNLKWIDAWALGDLPKLKTLDVSDREHLLMARHQLRENQILDNVKLNIYYLEPVEDLLEHILSHGRNVSIAVNFDGFKTECHEVRLNGYEKQWIVESLRMENFSCGFVMENVKSVRNVELISVIQNEIFGFRLENLPNLVKVALHENALGEMNNFKLEGNFENLTTIDLSNNRIKVINMSLFQKLDNLKQLNLEDNFLSRLSVIGTENFMNMLLLVDGNNFDCSWLNAISSSQVFQNLVFKSNFKSMNFKGLNCQLGCDVNLEYSPSNETLCSPCFMKSVNTSAQREQLEENNFLLKPELLMIIMCVVFALGIFATLISIHLYHKRRDLMKQPFYHLLRDSVIRPISDVRNTLRRDFKEVVSRKLPPTNYELPIPYETVTEMSDLATNIYEEIPQKDEPEMPTQLLG